MSKFDEAYLRMQNFGDVMLRRLADYKPAIDKLRSGRESVEGCPSPASAADTFYLAKIEEDLREVVAALKDARKELREECGTK